MQVIILMFLIFHGCKSDIFTEVSDLIPMISSIPSRNAPTTISKVHNLNVIRMTVKIAPIVLFQIEKKIPSMIKPRMETFRLFSKCNVSSFYLSNPQMIYLA